MAITNTVIGKVVPSPEVNKEELQNHIADLEEELEKAKEKLSDLESGQSAKLVTVAVKPGMSDRRRSQPI